MRHISIDALNEHIFEAIEMLKNNSDENASDNEKIDIDTARAIAELGKVVVDGYKVKAQVMNAIKNGSNPQSVFQMAIEGGIINREQQ
jgi:predicted transcriptional regulator